MSRGRKCPELFHSQQAALILSRCCEMLSVQTGPRSFSVRSKCILPRACAPLFVKQMEIASAVGGTHPPAHESHLVNSICEFSWFCARLLVFDIRDVSDSVPRKTPIPVVFPYPPAGFAAVRQVKALPNWNHLFDSWRTLLWSDRIKKRPQGRIVGIVQQCAF